MKNKSRSVLLILGLMVLVIGLSACGYVSTRGDDTRAIPHSTDWGFTNCLVCHADGDIVAGGNKADTHVSYTIELCLNPACHPLMSDLPTFIPDYTPPPTTSFTPPPPTTTTGTPPTTTTEPPTTATGSPGPISYDNHAPYTDASMCNMCHTGAAPLLANPEDHADYANDSCLDTGCHELAVE